MKMSVERKVVSVAGSMRSISRTPAEKKVMVRVEAERTRYWSFLRLVVGLVVGMMGVLLGGRD